MGMVNVLVYIKCFKIICLLNTPYQNLAQLPFYSKLDGILPFYLFTFFSPCMDLWQGQKFKWHFTDADHITMSTQFDLTVNDTPPLRLQSTDRIGQGKTYLWNVPQHIAEALARLGLAVIIRSSEQFFSIFHARKSGRKFGKWPCRPDSSGWKLAIYFFWSY